MAPAALALDLARAALPTNLTDIASTTATTTPIIKASLPIYLLQRRWSIPLVIGSYAVSVLGSYTTTQLMCQVPTTTKIWRKLGWIAVASVSFGGTGIWAMHFVSMLAMSIGIPIRYDIPMTLASAAIAIGATFFTFAYEILVREIDYSPLLDKLRELIPEWGYSPVSSHESDDGMPLVGAGSPRPSGTGASTPTRGEAGLRRRPSIYPDPPSDPTSPQVSNVDVLLPPYVDPSSEPAANPAPVATPGSSPVQPARTPPRPALSLRQVLSGEVSDISASTTSAPTSASDSSISLPLLNERSSRSSSDTMSANSDLAGRSAYLDSSLQSAQQARRELISSLWLGNTILGRNAWALWFSLTGMVVIKGALMGVTVCAMHYSGMWSMRMDGWIEWDYRLVICSFLVAWAICIIAIVYMPMEPNFTEQTVFSTLASAGVSAMHYVGMASGTFYTTRSPPHNSESVPPDLPLMILIVGTVTCLISYAMLAHLVTQSRDRLADMIMTKRTLWKVIAEREAFERANRLKSEFISVASHEIRTPLHAISGYTDLLLHTNLTEEQTTYLEAIRMGCHSIQLITNNVLDFSKLEKGAKESNARPVEINIRTLALRIVHSCALPHRMSEADMRRLAAQTEGKGGGGHLAISLPGEKNVELMLFVEENVPQTCYVDEVYITRVVMNLISNALKFTEEGYVLVRFCVEPPHAPETIPTLAISVKDTGIGISPEMTQAIFEPFRQADTSLTRSHTGAGLGLAISKQLCERMGGTIDLVTRRSHGRDVISGSEFTVRLPGLVRKDEPITLLPLPKPPTGTLNLSVAVRSKKTFELIRNHFTPRGFTIRAIELTHAARHNQPSLTKAERLWIDIECLASAPWLYQYVMGLQGRGSSVAAFIVCDEVGTDFGLRTMSTLKDAGRIVLAQRPLVLHELEVKLRLGIPKSEEKPLSLAALEKLGSRVDEKPIAAAPAPMPTPPAEVDTRISPVLVQPDQLSPFDSPELRHSPHSESLDQVMRALDPLQSVIRGPENETRSRKVHFQDSDSGWSRASSRPSSRASSPAPSWSSSSRPLTPIKPVSGSEAESEDVKSENERRKPCILLVEDNLVNQKLGIRMLHKLHYKVEVAENGKIALDLVTANRTRYALVLMDCQMPVMNGFECTRRIRALEASDSEHVHLPIIALTANVSSESREECEGAGADQFLPKPLLMEDLRAALLKWIESGDLPS